MKYFGFNSICFNFPTFSILLSFLLFFQNDFKGALNINRLDINSLNIDINSLNNLNIIDINMRQLNRKTQHADHQRVNWQCVLCPF